MTSSTIARPPTVSELRQIVGAQLQLLIEDGNIEGAKLLLIPVKPMDIAEATITGAGLPFLFNALGFDPALISAPFITTVVDILSIS